MFIEKDEVEHQINVLKSAKEALLEKNSLVLTELSDQTLHCALKYQNSGSMTMAVVLYSLSKIIERKGYQKIKGWDSLIKKINSLFDLTIKSLEDGNQEAYEDYLMRVRKTLESNAGNLKPIIHDILRKASINKAAKIYEHGISLERTAKMLGITQWELTDYTAQKNYNYPVIDSKLKTKERAFMALEFFRKK